MLRAGIGLDIGTTTVQAELVNLDTGESLETVSALNSQRSFGGDVMSRISAARCGKTGELFAAINRQVESIMKDFIRKWSLSAIEKCAVSGNTTMLHLFAGTDPSGMGASPYPPVFLEERHFSGGELSLSVEQLILLPGISAFVGADIVSGLAFIDIMNRGEDTLFVDIGTNGETAVWKKNDKRLLCCSAAAGPCFEELGIYGSELIDAVAQMKRLAVIDETGAMAGEYAQTGFPAVKGVVITQRDVRRFQLAKSAVFSGIDVMCKTAGLRAGNFASYIAGGLGFFINHESAVEVGLLPPELTARAEVCGNTSLKGAVRCLTDLSFLPMCREIASCGVTIDLAVDGDFAQAFADNMYF
jgi:uncharacterized 2Fe-2S/4Fe-4S cluster protein (DUF4445 family)